MPLGEETVLIYRAAFGGGEGGGGQTFGKLIHGYVLALPPTYTLSL